MPVTFRWSFLSGFLLGCCHAMYARKKIYLYTHTLGLGFGGGLGLCYNDFIKFWEVYRNPNLVWMKFILIY